MIRKRRKKPPPVVDHELVERIESFISEQDKMSATRFGLSAVGDRRLVPDLKKGRELRRETRQRIIAFIEQRSSGAAA